MPSVNEGLTIDGKPANEPTSDAFDRLEGGAAAGAAPTAAAPTPDPSLSTSQDIKSAVLSNEGSTELRDGLAVASEPETAPFVPDPALLAEGQRLLDADEAERARGQEAVHQLALREFADAVEYAEGPSEIAAALATLKGQVSEGEYTEALDAVSGAYLGFDPDDIEEFEDEEAAEAWGTFADQLDQQAATIANLRTAIEADQRLQGLLPVAAAERADAVHGLIKSWAHDQGFRSDAEANAAYQQAIAFARDALHVDLNAMETSIEAFDAKSYDAILRAAHAAIADQAEADSSRDIQQEVLDAESTSVADGIERWTPYGWVNPNAVELPPALVDEDRVVARAQAQRVSAQQIRDSLLAAEKASIEEGLTQNGKPTTAAKASGLSDQIQRDREDRARQLRALLP